MKLQALASVAVLLCTGFVSAMPNQQWGDNCYKCEYKYDDCGNEYGGYDISLSICLTLVSPINAHSTPASSSVTTIMWHHY